MLFVTVWGAMIVPKATVRVVDRLDPALAPAVVANVPVGLALFASLTSQVGDGLTRLTEQAFTLPDDLAYQRHGLIFGARLAAAATRLQITDAVFARNIRNYARQCVFHALLLGHISADDLREATDIWSLVTAGGTPSAGASPARMFEFATRQAAVGTGATPIAREIVTCQTGAGRLNAQWNAEIARAGTVFGRRIFPGSRTEALARAELLAALPAAHDFLIGASRSAGEIMRQQMVLNAVHDAGEQWAAEAGNAAALSAYTEARAEAQTVSAYRAIGRQAETWVPLLKIVFECLYIGAFPMAVLLMLTPAGTAIFRSYVTGLIWLQSWGPLYAVLHRISMGEAAERMSAVAAMPGGDIGISLVAQAGIRAVGSDVAVMSGYLSMSVPFLAAALAYGLSKATVLATSVLAVGQDAASSAAHEGATGNLSLANTGYDTHRFATLEGRQIRTSAHVDTDRYTGYAPAGAGFTVTGDGTAVADAGSATSRIPAAGVRLSESLATSHEERAADARSTARNWSAEAATARTAAANDATAMVQRYTHDVTAGTAHGRGVTESESSQAQELAGHIDKLAEIGGISKNQAAALTGEARVGGSWDFIVKAGADGSAMWRGQTIESDAWNRIKEYDRQHGVTETWSKVADASKRWSTQTGDSEMGSLEESLGANLTRMRSYGERASLSTPGGRQLVRAGGTGAHRRPGDRARARPALLRLALGAQGDGRTADRRRRGHAARLAANAGGCRGTAGPRGGLHRRTLPRTGPARSGLGRRQGGLRRCPGQARRGLHARDRGRPCRVVGRRARPRGGGGRAPAGRRRRGGAGRTCGNGNRSHHARRRARGAGDGDEAGRRGGSRGDGRRSRQAVRRACGKGRAGDRRLACRQALRLGPERRTGRRPARGHGPEARPAGPQARPGRQLAVTDLLAPAHQALMLLGDRHPGVLAGLRDVIHAFRIVRKPVTAKGGPVPIPEAAPYRQGEGGRDGPGDGDRPERPGEAGSGAERMIRDGPERRGGETAEHDGAFGPCVYAYGRRGAAGGVGYSGHVRILPSRRRGGRTPVSAPFSGPVCFAPAPAGLRLLAAAGQVLADPKLKPAGRTRT